MAVPQLRAPQSQCPVPRRTRAAREIFILDRCGVLVRDDETAVYKLTVLTVVHT